MAVGVGSTAVGGGVAVSGGVAGVGDGSVSQISPHDEVGVGVGFSTQNGAQLEMSVGVAVGRVTVRQSGLQPLAVGVGVAVGVFVGVLVGVLVGVSVGVLVAVFVGVLVGVSVGVLVAAFVGVLVGVSVGVLVRGTGVLVGASVGVLGSIDGTVCGVVVAVGVGQLGLRYPPRSQLAVGRGLGPRGVGFPEGCAPALMVAASRKNAAASVSRSILRMFHLVAQDGLSVLQGCHPTRRGFTIQDKTYARTGNCLCNSCPGINPRAEVRNTVSIRAKPG